MISLISVLRNIRVYAARISDALLNQPPTFPELSLAGNSYPLRKLAPKTNLSPQSILEDIIGKGYLWGVPKARRSLERRMTRRMGFGKVIRLKNNLIVCDDCGHFHPVHTICGHCYEKVKAETQLMQEAVFKELKLDPIEQEVCVVYENDPNEARMFGRKHIIEMPKERPSWFCKNLLTKDSEIPRKKTVQLSDTSITPKIENA